MVDLGYAYANARVKGMKSNLLGSHVFRELMQVRTVDEVIALLEQTPYKKDLVEASRMRSGVQLVDVALSNNLARTIATMGRIMPKHASGLFSLLTADWDAQNIKLILSKKALGKEVAESELIGSHGKAKLFLQKLAKAKNMKDAISIVTSGWGLKEFRISMKNLVEKEPEPDLRKLIAKIEEERARRLTVLSKKSDRLTARIVEAQLALESVMAVMRLKREGVKDEEKYVVYRNALVRKLLHTPDFEHCIKEIASAYQLPPEVAEKSRNSLSLLEIALEKKTAERIMRWTRMSVLSFATAVGFVFLKNLEVSNLRKIAYASAFGLKEELKEYVFAINA